MPCTTILVGKNATNDGSTMMARNDDGFFGVKKMIVVNPKDQPKKYKTKISHLTIELPDNPLRYTSIPNVDESRGIWPAAGINSKNVAMTATETISSNMLVMGADPLVIYKKEKGKEIPGGIGEEDLVTIVLPYINSAREGVIRLGELLEKYGTYEMNGIGFADEDEVWWFETIGGHNFIASRLDDDKYLIAPNEFTTDTFDLNDAYGKQEKYICSKGLKDLIEKYHLDCNNDNTFNPRKVFGSHSDQDHIYNTPRAWYMARYFNPTTYKWDNENADFTPESDNIPCTFKPEKKITIEEVKYILSSYFQGTPYNPYNKGNDPRKTMYRPIAVAKTDCMAILQIRNNVPEQIKGLEWICFACNAFNTVLPFYTNTSKMPKYISNTTLEFDSNNFYWGSRLIGCIADAHYGSLIQDIDRYQNMSLAISQRIINEYDEKMIKDNDYSLIDKANEEVANEGKKLTIQTINALLKDAGPHSKLFFNRSDN